jgi:hypothetical protein
MKACETLNIKSKNGVISAVTAKRKCLVSDLSCGAVALAGNNVEAVSAGVAKRKKSGN